MELLPQQIAPITPKQAELTARFLKPAISELLLGFGRLRDVADIELSAHYPFANGKPYPLGRCNIILNTVFKLLMQEYRNNSSGKLVAVFDFLRAGGMLRSIWGVLRNREFQNALQLGGLYVDVANDTVDTRKPKIEILPLEESGMESVADIAHFAGIAQNYWGVDIYANHVIPGLAPILPIISVLPGKMPRLQSASDYMIDLCRRDNFKNAEHWLATAQSPPDSLIHQLRSVVPKQLIPNIPEEGKRAALLASQTARSQGCAFDAAWRDARVQEYLAVELAVRNASFVMTTQI